MASLSGVVLAEHVNSLGRSVSYHRTGSGSSRSTSIVSAPVEHLQTVQSGIPVDWPTYPPPTPPSWITRNDSTKAYYEGSVANVPFTNRVKRGVGLSDSRKPDIWRAAAVELVATTGLTFLSITVHFQGTKASVAAAALLQALIYSVAILAAAPTSGGHLNPAITFTTFITGQATLIRSVLYIAAQLLGGIIGAAGVRLLTSNEARTNSSMGGCLLQEIPVTTTASTLSNKQGLFAEMVFTIIMLFVVYGIGFDTRSMVVTFPISAPFIIGGVFGVLMFVSQGLGYTTAMNPARCVGPAVIYGHNLWNPLYAFVIGPLLGALIVGMFQSLVHQAHGAEVGPVLPLNFLQTVTPDHRRPGFGPRGPPVNNLPTGDVSDQSQASDQDISHSHHLVAHSQPLLSNVPGTVSSVLEFPATSEPGTSASSNRFSLTLQIKAFMQPTRSECNQGSAVPIVDATEPADDQRLTLQQHSNSTQSSPARAVSAGDPDIDSSLHCGSH